jgi:hypothetical protein
MPRRSFKMFLAQFDAIFSLNQDLLLERHYLPVFVQTRWDGVVCPGTRLQERPVDPMEPTTLGIWVPDDERNFVVPPRCQPLFKLHGSSNWRAGPNQNIMVLGGQKRELIDKHPILRFNFAQFDAYLRCPDARLMIIGYGFGDDHVNQAIQAAVRESGTTLFVVDPEGIDVMDANRNATIYTTAELAKELWPSERGTSRRPLASTFRGDRAEYSKLMSFFR